MLAALLVAAVAACGDDPVEVQFEVIDEVTFADTFVSSAGDTIVFNLANLTEQSSGVWTQDLAVGVGDTAAQGDSVFISYTGWIRDGTEFDSGGFAAYGFRFFYTGGAIPGIHFGMQGQQLGGSRLIVIPPELAYGQVGAGGIIYPGAIVVFEVTLDSIQPVP